MSEQNENRTEISELGEFGLIAKLTNSFKLKNESSVKGVGDDAAVIDHGEKYMVVTTDLLLEGIHFDLMYMPLKHLGYKAVVVNLSDVYAMNANPRQITVSIGLSNRFSVESLEELYEGMKAACDFYKVDLVGGDTTSSKQGLVISVTAIGSVDKDKIVYRSGAKPGDILCVSGDLGAAYLGLQLLEREKQVFLSQGGAIRPELEQQKYVVGRHLKPEARYDVIENLAKKDILPTSMIDVSDGISSDIRHICKSSETGVFIDEEDLPIHEEAQLLALRFNVDPTTCAMNGGEDYELLFTIDPLDFEKITKIPDISKIGLITPPEEGIKLHTSGGNIRDIPAQGWKHF